MRTVCRERSSKRSASASGRSGRQCGVAPAFAAVLGQDVAAGIEQACALCQGIHAQRLQRDVRRGFVLRRKGGDGILRNEACARAGFGRDARLGVLEIAGHRENAGERHRGAEQDEADDEQLRFQRQIGEESKHGERCNLRGVICGSRASALPLRRCRLGNGRKCACAGRCRRPAVAMRCFDASSTSSLADVVSHNPLTIGPGHCPTSQPPCHRGDALSTECSGAAINR